MDATLDEGVVGLSRDRGRMMADFGTRAVGLGTVTLVGISLLVWGGRGFPDQPLSFLHSPVGFVLLAVIAVTYASIGAFLATHLPRHAVGWSLLVIGAGVALHLPASLAVSQAVSSFHPVQPVLLVSVWALTSAFVPLAVALTAVLLLILPDGHLPSRRWWGSAILSLVGLHVLTVATALEPSGTVWFPTLPNPLGVPASLAPMAAAGRATGVCLMVGGLCVAALAMVQRYRRGDAATQRQLRWIARGAIVWAGTLAPLMVVRYVIGTSADFGADILLLAGAGTLAVPITIFIATFRYHLFGIDALVNRTLVYVPLMGVCGGLYAAGLVLSQRLFLLLTGNTSDTAVILATLLMAGAITPVRRILETLVERGVGASPPPPEATDDETYREYRELIDQAGTLAARLAEVERRLEQRRPGPDPTREVGEPGVGRSVSRLGRSDPRA